jgi:hypothetical protein
MANTAAAFKQADLTRALKSAAAVGLPVVKFSVARDGTVTIYTTGGDTSDGPNPFDERLK